MKPQGKHNRLNNFIRCRISEESDRSNRTLIHLFNFSVSSAFVGRGGGSPYASWWSTCCATTTTSAEQRRVHMVSYSTTVHDCTQLHNLSYLSGEHNCTRFPTSGQGYFLRQRHGVHHLRLLITAPEPSQPLCLEQQNRNNLLQSTFHQDLK